MVPSFCGTTKVGTLFPCDCCRFLLSFGYILFSIQCLALLRIVPLSTFELLKWNYVTSVSSMNADSGNNSAALIFCTEANHYCRSVSELKETDVLTSRSFKFVSMKIGSQVLNSFYGFDLWLPALELKNNPPNCPYLDLPPGNRLYPFLQLSSLHDVTECWVLQFSKSVKVILICIEQQWHSV